MATKQETAHCPTSITLRDCDLRHRGITRWLNTIIGLMVVMFGTTGSAFLVARGAAQDIAVQTAVQEEVNKRVLASLERIERDVRILRNGSSHE